MRAISSFYGMIMGVVKYLFLPIWLGGNFCHALKIKGKNMLISNMIFLAYGLIICILCKINLAILGEIVSIVFALASIVMIVIVYSQRRRNAFRATGILATAYVAISSASVHGTSGSFGKTFGFSLILLGIICIASVIPFEKLRKAFRGREREEPKEKHSIKDAIKEIISEDTPKETSKETPDEAPKKTSKETPDEAPKKLRRTGLHEKKAEEPPKEALKEAPKEAPKEPRKKEPIVISISLDPSTITTAIVIAVCLIAVLIII